MPLSSEVGPKRWFLGPRFVGERDTPDFGHAFSNYTYFRPCDQIWFSSVQRAERVADEKKERKNLGKIFPPTYYVGRPNKNTIDRDAQY